MLGNAQTIADSYNILVYKHCVEENSAEINDRLLQMGKIYLYFIKTMDTKFFIAAKNQLNDVDVAFFSTLCDICGNRFTNNFIFLSYAMLYGFNSIH